MAKKKQEANIFDKFMHVQGYKISKCSCTRDICDEWNLTLEAEFPLKYFNAIVLFGRIYLIDKVVVRTNYYGLGEADTAIPDIGLFILQTKEGKDLPCFEVPYYILREIADVFKYLEDKKDKSLNECYISEEIYSYIESIKAKGDDNVLF